MLEQILIFIIFLGPLVFFHELGHFFFARLFGVRVEVFSIGFGPKLLKYKMGDTEYAWSLIPLGGYVKMFGDNPLTKDEIPDEDRPHSFTHKNKWQRFWIVMGGPLANFVLAYFIFYALLVSGERIPEIRIGVIEKTNVLYSKGLRSGDVIKKVNGVPVYNPSDVVVEGQEEIKGIVVSRSGKEVVIPSSVSGEDFQESFAKSPLMRAPVVTNGKNERFAVSLTEDKVDWNLSLDQIQYSESPIQKLTLFKVKKDAPAKKGDSYATLALEKDNKNTITLSTPNNAIESLKQAGFYPVDLMIKSVNMKSPSDKAGLKGGNVIVGVDGKKLNSFYDLRNAIDKANEGAVNLQIIDNGVERNVSLTPQVKTIKKKKIKLIGVYSAGVFQGIRFYNTNSRGFFNSFYLAFPRTWESILKTVDGFKKLITAEVSAKNIGGPLAIGKVATDSFNTSFSYFFQLMALISINLGIINLFPIPVLDGGHIMFIFLEVLNRGPVSRRKMEIAQQFGLSLLLMLMVGALYNDVVRFF
ncbi:MAG: regulator of sigma E protease [Bacteriovoracaceae bacterium]|jgi:regulator of sigma E protease